MVPNQQGKSITGTELRLNWDLCSELSLPTIGQTHRRCHSERVSPAFHVDIQTREVIAGIKRWDN